jgi:peptide-methionine (S)-S-oxide reductase
MAKSARLLVAALALIAGGSAAWPDEQRLETAIFAGGCFWCVEADFDPVPGVVETISGFTGGTTENPTYEDVGWGNTGHYEAVQITYDTDTVTYEELLYVFWRSIDPTDGGGQFCDRGPSYKTAIFATSDAQRAAAEASRQALIDADVLGDDIVTPVLAAETFYPAEAYHQDYYRAHPLQYNWYRFGCERDRRVKDLWGDEAWGGQGHGGS